MTYDLFSDQNYSRPADRPKPQVLAAPALPVPQLPRGSIQWERMIAEVAGLVLTMQVSTLWTGEVLEVLSGHRTGRKALFRDGTIRDLPGAADPERIAYLTPARALELHARHGLALLGRPGSATARFRFALAGEEGNAAGVMAWLAAVARSAGP